MLIAHEYASANRILHQSGFELADLDSVERVQSMARRHPDGSIRTLDEVVNGSFWKPVGRSKTPNNVHWRNWNANNPAKVLLSADPDQQAQRSECEADSCRSAKHQAGTIPITSNITGNRMQVTIFARCYGKRTFYRKPPMHAAWKSWSLRMIDRHNTSSKRK